MPCMDAHTQFIGSAQTTCYSNQDFECTGTGTIRGIPDQCCSEGFLSFLVAGSNTCEQCPGKYQD